jgi:glycoprotease/Kae1 family metallohydrolase
MVNRETTEIIAKTIKIALPIGSVKVLGIESTAHSFGAGFVDGGEVVSNVLDMYVPEEGGIHPRRAAEHHAAVADGIVAKAMKGKPDAVAYSCGPGIGTCLKVGTETAKRLGKEHGVPLIPVNHAVAHIEIGLKTTGLKEPVVVYVSGGNTQIIADRGGWKVFGETLDIALGNALDKLARKMGIGHPGGPAIERLSRKGRFLEMPYVVKGMDLSFSGLTTHAVRLLDGHSGEDVAYSFQEHAFAMLVEVAERALAHTGNDELLLVGGVARNRRLKEMFGTMCRERGARFEVVPDEFAGDNGAMIAYAGYRSRLRIPPEDADYFQKIRVDTDLGKLFHRRT